MMSTQQPEELLQPRCEVCGAVLVKGRCPRCHPVEVGECLNPEETDCDCPVVGYIKVHAPWCKYY